jgi:hypothetical protein
MYYLFVQLYYINAHKTFLGDDHGMMTSFFFIQKNFLQNCCEHNFMPFKEFFSEYVPKEKDEPEWNKRGQTLVFNYYVHLECLANFSRIHQNLDTRLVISDRQECFDTYNWMFEGVSEFLSGPCISNQAKIYNYKIDIWTAYIHRVIDDIDSSFYQVKYQCLKYVRSFIEGYESHKNEKIVKFIAMNANPTKLYNLMITLVKKLYIKHKFTLDPKLKSKWGYGEGNPKAKAEKLKRSNSGFMISQNKDNIESHYLGMESLNCTESIITEEAEKAIHIPSLECLEEAYISSKEFADHIVIQIVMSLYAFMENCKDSSFIYKAFMDERDEILRKHYTDKRNMQDYDDVHAYEEEDAGGIDDEDSIPEDILIYCFIQRITSKIEIAFQADPRKKETQLTQLYFRKLPSCWFLTHESKKSFQETVDLDTTTSKRMALLNYTDMFIVEMKENEQLYKDSKLIYRLSTNDSLLFYSYIQYILGIILNFVCFLFYRQDNARTTFSADQGSFSNAWWVITGLSILMITISSFFLF